MMTPPEESEKRSLGEWASDSQDKIIEKAEDLKESMAETREQLIQKLGEMTVDIKPRLRGWAHLATIPFMLIGNLLLLVLTEDLKARAGIAVFAFGSLLLLSTSSVYHRSNGWVNAKTHMLLHRLDHTSISILIASTCTPFALLLLKGWQTIACLSMIWSLALLASMIRFFFSEMLHKYFSVAVYIGVGWVPVMFGPSFYQGAVASGGTVGYYIIGLIIAGGLLYTIGAAVFFGLRPKFWHRENVWSYHENFHIFTILAMFCHYAALALIAFYI